MIKFAKERVNLICNQLKGWSIVQKVHLDSMRVKEDALSLRRRLTLPQASGKILTWEKITGTARTAITGSGQK